MTAAGPIVQTTPLVDLRGVTLTYPGAGAAVLDAVDLAVQPGEFVVLAGASGSGKSTLLGLLCGLVPHTTGGTVHGSGHVGGIDLAGAGPRELGTVCGYVGQEPERQVVMTTVRAELALGPEVRGASTAAVRRAVEEVALALGLADRLDRELTTLSGGELQRVALGAALTAQPALLVLDEPTSQLDPVAGDELLGLLRRLNEEWGVTVILAEHRLERCLGAADRVVALERGRITFSGPPAEFCGWAAAQDPAVATSATRVLHEVAPELAGAAITVKQARAALEQRGLLHDASPGSATLSRAALPASSDAGLPRPLETPGAPARRRLARRATRGVPPAGTAVRATGVWRELGSGQTLLRGIDLSLAPGEAVALMGRNGAGKTTLLRLLAGLDRPDRGRVEAAGRVALLLQRSSDHLLHERVGDELPDGVTAASIGLGDDPAILDRHPRDLSGGQGQLLAAAVVAGASAPAVLCLDEPTRGLDRLHRAELAAELQRRRAEGTATLVATHDPEFAATVADRVILLGQGAVLADGPAAEILEGGWYFATELARILQTPGVVTPSQASALLARRTQLLDAAQNPQEPQS